MVRDNTGSRFRNNMWNKIFVVRNYFEMRKKLIHLNKKRTAKDYAWFRSLKGTL